MQLRVMMKEKQGRVRGGGGQVVVKRSSCFEFATHALTAKNPHARNATVHMPSPAPQVTSVTNAPSITRGSCVTRAATVLGSQSQARTTSAMQRTMAPDDGPSPPCRRSSVGKAGTSKLWMYGRTTCSMCSRALECTYRASVTMRASAARRVMALAAKATADATAAPNREKHVMLTECHGR